MDISNDDDAPMTNQSQSTSYQHSMLYVVQRCWHSGPRQHVPVDMLRLFHTQREAEEGAYHSATAFHNAHSKSSGHVKTLLLPSYPAHNPQGSSYGFLACGGLFWVRAVRVTIVAASSNNDNNNNTMCHSAAYAILTEGVIGGTGNRNSRRGTEVCDGRVFGGDATARLMAMEAVSRVQSNLANPSLRVHAQTVPVGKPVGWLSSGSFVMDWPVHAELGNDNNNNSTSTPEVPFGTTPKRHIGSFENSTSTSSATHWGRSVSSQNMSEGLSSSSSGDSTAIASEPNALIGGNSNNESYIVVDCPFEEPIAKRRRVVSVADEYAMMMQ